jgi:hypothetical protein
MGWACFMYFLSLYRLCGSKTSKTICVLVPKNLQSEQFICWIQHVLIECLCEYDTSSTCFMYFLSWSICSKDYTNIKVIKSLRYKTFTRRQVLYIDWYTDDLKFYLYYNSLIHGQADLLMSPVRLWKIETSGLTVIKRLSTHPCIYFICWIKFHVSNL